MIISYISSKPYSESSRSFCIRQWWCISLLYIAVWVRFVLECFQPSASSRSLENNPLKIWPSGACCAQKSGWAGFRPLEWTFLQSDFNEPQQIFHAHCLVSKTFSLSSFDSSVGNQDNYLWQTVLSLIRRRKKQCARELISIWKKLTRGFAVSVVW